MWVTVAWVKPMNSRLAMLLATEGSFGTEVGIVLLKDTKVLVEEMVKQQLRASYPKISEVYSGLIN